MSLLIAFPATFAAGIFAWQTDAGNATVQNTQDGVLEFGDPALNGLKSSQGTVLLKGGSYAVRGLEQDIVDDNTKRVPYEIYRDDDFGTMAYVTETGSIAAVPYRKGFQVSSMGLGDGGFEVVRFSPGTGAAWRMIDEKWTTIGEVDPDMPRPGDYEIKLTDIGGAALIVRIDQRLGVTWLLDGESWKRVVEEGK